MPVPMGYQLRWLVAVGGEDRGNLAFEQLASARLLVELKSDPDPPFPLDYNAHVEGTFNIGGRQVTAYVPNDETFPTLTLAWTHKDANYTLDVTALSVFDPPTIDAAEFAPLVATVRYADP
jgi:hypothetical protein